MRTTKLKVFFFILSQPLFRVGEPIFLFGQSFFRLINFFGVGTWRSFQSLKFCIEERDHLICTLDRRFLEGDDAFKPLAGRFHYLGHVVAPGEMVEGSWVLSKSPLYESELLNARQAAIAAMLSVFNLQRAPSGVADSRPRVYGLAMRAVLIPTYEISRGKVTAALLFL
jgi:hypothetical protein